MGNERKRVHHDDSSSSSSKVDHHKKPYSSSASKPPSNSAQNHHHHHHQQQQIGKHPTFASYLETPNLRPKIKLLCEIIANTPSLGVEKVLDETGVRVSQEDVEEVLKLSYGFPGPAVKFFRWAGYQLNDKHSPYAWNLVVDLLGKNCLFDAMWDAIKSMKKEGLLSLATFASVFSSYVTADRVQEAIMTFEVMDQYGCLRDIVALNSLLSAICREGKTGRAKEFLYVAKNTIRPDADSYAILLEGWESEGNVAGARQTFAEMVIEIGWDPRNVPAYDSFLTTLLKGPEGMHEVLSFLQTMNERRCCPGMKFFKLALEDCAEKGDTKAAGVLWDAMVGRNGFKPDTDIYNSMMAVHCYASDLEIANRLLDEMVYHGAFPNSKTYNLLFQFLIKRRKLQESFSVFEEMVKNECPPSHSNSRTAVKIYVDNRHSDLAIKVWRFMVETYDKGVLEETGNYLVVGLRDNNWLPEAVKYAEDMIDRGIKLNSASLSKLKQSLSKAGKGFAYDELLRKWKAR